MIELLFAAYFSMSCENLGKTYNYPTVYRIGMGCYTTKGTFLPRAKCTGLAVCSVASSLEAHEIMTKEVAFKKSQDGGTSIIETKNN